jgi:hypothetical protein
MKNLLLVLFLILFAEILFAQTPNPPNIVSEQPVGTSIQYYYGNNGATLWQEKEAKRPIFFSSPDQKYLYMIDEEVIKEYELEKQK